MLPSNHVLILQLCFPFFVSLHIIWVCFKSIHPPDPRWKTPLSPPPLFLVPSACAYSILMGACVCLGTGCYQRAYARLHRLIPCSRLVNMFTCISLRSLDRSRGILLPPLWKKKISRLIWFGWRDRTVFHLEPVVAFGTNTSSHLTGTCCPLPIEEWIWNTHSALPITLSPSLHKAAASTIPFPPYSLFHTQINRQFATPLTLSVWLSVDMLYWFVLNKCAQINKATHYCFALLFFYQHCATWWQC